MSQKRGMDTLLTKKGKALRTGEQISFTLIKGPRLNQIKVADPVNPAAPKESFPLIAKFPDTVVRPDFSNRVWKEARLYQQDIPKAEEDSDEEAKPKDGTKKRWRRRREEAPKRQWILQEEVEFLETMMAKRKKKPVPKYTESLSTRYEGIPEHNPSHFALLEAQTTNDHTVQVVLVPPPPNATVTFAQPDSRKTLSLTEAEQAIQDQRTATSRYMMHNKVKSTSSFLNANAKSDARARLMGKVKRAAAAASTGDDDEADDVMGDVAFRERKGAGRARQELLTSLGDDGVKVDTDGVLGGAHDDEFGGKRRFGAFKVSKEDQSKNNKSGAPATDTKEANADAAGMAMDDGFYQRDVKGEYDELDYDVNEQFDDDDVDVGETEITMADGYQHDDDDDDDGEEDMEEAGMQLTGAEGLASVAGFKAMLAKARGEGPSNNAEAEGANGGASANGNEAEKKDAANVHAATPTENKAKPQPQSHLEKIMAAAEKSAEEAKKRKENKNAAEVTGVELDANGLRVVSLEAIRKEIWLHHGAISTKRLMKIFKINKKSSPERQSKFRDVLRELCTVTTDPIGGRMLVLKQHYRT